MGHDAQETKKHVGSCHCGAVRFEVDVDLSEGASGCNCSICTKIASLGAIVKPNAFKLLAGEESLSSYAWGAKISTRYFCKNCGIHCFGRGHLAEVGGDFVSVNVNTLDDIDLSTMPLTYWDGRNNNWQSGTRKTRWPNTPSAS